MKIALMALVLLIAGCGGDAEPTTTSGVAAPATSTTSGETTTTAAVATTTVAPTTTTEAVETTTSTTTTSTVPPTVCPVSVPLPEGTLTFAGVFGDFDGDGSADELRTYQAGSDDWRVRIVFADGGGADAAINGGEDFAPPHPIGGYDIDGDGTEEVFLTVGSGASTAQVGFFDVVACVATRITTGGMPAVFGVGGSVGMISGISCPGDGSIQRNFASYVADDAYEGGFEPFVLEGSVLTGFPGDGAGFTADEAFALAVLDCGSLTMP